MTTMEHVEKDTSSPEESQIRGIFESWAKAIRAQDSRALVSSLAPDVLMFDVIDPLQYVGPDATRKRAEEWLSSFQSPINYETRDLGSLPARMLHSPTASTGSTLRRKTEEKSTCGGEPRFVFANARDDGW